MRVITGSARGRRLEAPAGQDTRPTADRVKEAIFSIIQFEIEGRRVLDLFAGSGQLGIEALSRGAASAIFVDKDKAAVEAVRKNLESTGFKSASVVNADSLSYMALSRDTFDIIFIDPPYGQGLLEKALSLAAEHISQHGAIICETAFGGSLPPALATGFVPREYKYGKTLITVYRQGDV